MPNNLEITDDNIDEFLICYNTALTDNSMRLEFDEARRAALTGWGDLQACPGSGKTTLVAAKLMILAKKWDSKHKGICVLTHTNVACDEIRSRLEKDADGHKLLSYPHFIGTIQEFVNRFLALPSIRKDNEGIRFIDDDTGKFDVLNSGENLTNIYLSLFRKFGGTGRQFPINEAIFSQICESLGSLFWLNTDYDLGYFGANNNLITVKCDMTKSIYPKLAALKIAMQNKGRFQYRDMYVFAHDLVLNSVSICETLRQRFTVIIIDEMQDTQKYQDDLINRVFQCEDVKIQRFGDPDQAIFDNMGGEEPNETFNNNADLILLKHSHRFPEDIAAKAATLSLSQIGNIEAIDPPDSPHLHTVFLYDDPTKVNVLGAFTALVDESDPEGKWDTVKAVGATEGEGGHISAYWDGFEKRKQALRPRPKSLIEAIKREWWKTNPNSEFQYNLVVQAILDLMRMAEKLDTRNEAHKYFNKYGLKSWLLKTERYAEFRKIITHWIVSRDPQREEWQHQTEALKILLDLPESNAISEYLAFNVAPNAEDNNGNVDSVANIYSAENGREIEVGTIHSVKGETHDATLILETKYYQNDIQLLIDHLAGIDTSRITASRKSKFTRQLYVAASRPRHLLCIAIHKDNITEPQKDALGIVGWQLKPIYEADDE